MSTGHPEDAPSPDQFLVRLIEMEGLIERQTVALNALEVERDHFKGAFEEADAERQRLELVIRQLLRAQFGRKSERLDPEQFQLTLENLEQEIAAAKGKRHLLSTLRGGSSRARLLGWFPEQGLDQAA
jgi:hypothetical protein